MKLYRMSESNKKITVEEIEVEEKPKTYRIRGRFNYSVINKCDIGKLGNFGNGTYFLVPDVDTYKQALKERTLKEIKEQERRIEYCRKAIEQKARRLVEIDGMEVSAD